MKEQEMNKIIKYESCKPPKKLYATRVNIGVIVISSALLFGSTFGLYGCNKTPAAPDNTPAITETQNNNENNAPTNQNTQNTNQGDTNKEQDSANQTDNPATETKTKAQLVDEAKTAWGAYLNTLNAGNYKVEIQNGTSTCVYMIDDNAVVKEEVGSTTTYYVFDANGNYKLTSADGTTYSKTATTATSANDFFLGAISDAIVSDVNDDGSFVLQDDKNYTCTFDGNGNLTMTAAGTTVKVGGVGTIALTAPQIAADNIYEVDAHGNKVFNCALIGEVVENWLKGDNQYGEDYLSYRYKVALGSSYDETVMPTTDKILYVKASEDYIGIVILSDHKVSGKQISERYFNLSSFYSALKDGSIQTADELKNYLNTNKDLILGKNVITNIDYTTLDDDYATAHKEQFEALTESVFNRIETVGTHSYKDTVNANSTLDGFSDGTILFAYKTTPTATGAGGGLGQYQSWNQCYLIERNGNLELIKFNIWSSTYNGVLNCYENVLAGDEDASKASFWYVSKVEVKENIDKTNLALFEIKNNEKILEN